MRKILMNCLVMVAMAIVWMGCERDEDYLIGTPSSYIANLDLRKLYKGSDVTLTSENMRGATYVRGQVISDHSENNLPAGLLVIQNLRTAGNGIDSLRGIAINIGADATKYVPGDSVHVKIEGAILKRVDGILTITGVSSADVEKKASGKPVIQNRGFGNLITKFPDRFESTLLNIWKGTYNPTLAAGTTLSGIKTLNDGTSDLLMETLPGAKFASVVPPYSGNYKGIIFNKIATDGKLVPTLRVRNTNDMVALSSTVDIPEFVISGFINDPNGGDGNNEYIQFRATRDINFAVTPFSICTSNNAGASNPTGFPLNGWATGGLKTYKIELKSGTVAKGEFFYVGGVNKLIAGPNSTSIASAKWIAALNYNTSSPKFNSTQANFGQATTNLLANSGNAFGIAAFRGIEITEKSVPIDVVWVHDGGSLYQANPAVGYRIGNTDIYDIIDPSNGNSQPFYLSGSNKQKFLYTSPTDVSFFYILGGTFDTVLSKWTGARSQTNVRLAKTASIAEIEGDNATAIK
ncbi:DUF5689 domain-containing protein [Pedobacter sp. PWIIR3]